MNRRPSHRTTPETSRTGWTRHARAASRTGWVPRITVERGPTGAAVWHVPGWKHVILWNGVGSRLWLAPPGHSPHSHSLIRIDHPTADGNYRTYAEASRAAKRFVAMPTESQDTGRDRTKRRREESPFARWTVPQYHRPIGGTNEDRANTYRKLAKDRLTYARGYDKAVADAVRNGRKRSDPLLRRWKRESDRLRRQAQQALDRAQVFRGVSSRRNVDQRDPPPLKGHRGYTLRSGRRVLGTIRPTAVRGVYAWASNFTQDRGITSSLGNAERLLLREAGMSTRQHEIDLVDNATGQRRPVAPTMPERDRSSSRRAAKRRKF